MKTIKIAPDLDEIIVEANVMRTDFAGGVTYEADGLNKYDERFLKESFQAAIAMAGKRWVLEQVLNAHFHLDGKIS